MRIPSGNEENWSPQTVAWLASPEGEKVWQSLVDIADPLTCMSALRKRLPRELASAAVTVAQLQPKRAKKFPGAPLLADKRSLEQATDSAVASHKAERFIGLEEVADLCCGMGGDLMAIAARTQAMGVDQNPVMAMIAQYNLQSRSLKSAKVMTGRAEEIDTADFAAWHIDPDRRPHATKTIRLEDSLPDLAVLTQLFERNAHAAWKLAPACTLPLEWSERGEREFISSGDECRQQVLWLGKLATSVGSKRATRLALPGTLAHPIRPDSFSWREDVPLIPAAAPGQYLHELDPALLAAGGAGAFAQHINAKTLTPGGGYLTSDYPCEHPLGRSYSVLAELPPRLDKVQAWLKDRRAGLVTVKKRGVSLDPAVWAKHLRGTGEENFTLCCYPSGKKMVVLATQPV